MNVIENCGYSVPTGGRGGVGAGLGGKLEEEGKEWVVAGGDDGGCAGNGLRDVCCSKNMLWLGDSRRLEI